MKESNPPRHGLIYSAHTPHYCKPSPSQMPEGSIWRCVECYTFWWSTNPYGRVFQWERVRWWQLSRRQRIRDLMSIR